MELRMSRLSLAGLALALAALFGVPGPAVAATMCVTCVGPDATYRCVSEAASSPTDARYQFLCITEIAKSGGHQSCSVSRNASGPCEGPERVVGLAPDYAAGTPPLNASPSDVAPTPAGMTPLPPAVATQPPLQPAATQAPVPATPSGQTDIPKSEPETIEDMAKDASASTPLGKVGKAVEDTGNTINSAAKKTWECLTSLFNDC